MNKRQTSFFLGAVALLAAFTACDDTTSTIGSALTSGNVEIMVDSDFTITGHAVPLTAIRPKTTEQLIGALDIPGYGILRSDFVGQFLPATELDSKYTPENVDSIVLTMRYARGAFIGDSLLPQAITLYQLNQPIAATIGSDFDPEDYYDHTPLASTIFNASTLNESEDDQAATYRDIKIKLPDQLGRDLFQAYLDNPSNYEDGRVFAKNVFAGIYAKNTFGSGRLTNVSVCGITLHMHRIYTPLGETEPDTAYLNPLYYLITPEVVSTNLLQYKMSKKLEDMLAQDKTPLIAPLGADIEFEFPTPEIIKRYNAAKDGLSIVNTLSLSIPADSIETGFGVTPPPYVLMVLKKDREEFFSKNKLADNVTSFYATYNTTTNSYIFSGMRPYILEMLEKDEITPEDYTFCLVPVQVNFEDLASSSSYYSYYYGSTTSQTESEILPYLLSPVMADVKLDEAKIKFTFTLQNKK